MRVTYEMKPLESAKIFLSGLLEHIGVNGFVDGVVTEEGTIALNVTGENMGVVIGRRGDTLDALQYITSIVVNRGGKEHVRVTVDTENYRKKREESLEALAHKVAGRVLKYKKNVTLEPMNANERRVIHSALQGTRGSHDVLDGKTSQTAALLWRWQVLVGPGTRGPQRSGGERPERTAAEPPKAASIPVIEEEWK